MVVLAGFNTDSLGNLMSQIGYLMILTLVVVAVVGGLIWWISNRKKYNSIALILEKDGFGVPYLSKDAAGIFVDGRTRNKLLFLKDNKVGMSPDNVPFLSGFGNKRFIFLKRIGLKNFKYISFANFFKEAEQITVGDEDVNWAINAYQAQKNLSSDWLKVWLPYIGMAIFMIFALGLVAIILGKFDVLNKVVDGLNLAAQTCTGGGTEVITKP